MEIKRVNAASCAASKLSEHFGISIDELLGINKEPPESEGLDEALVQLLQRVSKEKVQRVKDFVAGLLD